jgi:hypothetical protein
VLIHPFAGNVRANPMPRFTHYPGRRLIATPAAATAIKPIGSPPAKPTARRGTTAGPPKIACSATDRLLGNALLVGELPSTAVGGVLVIPMAEGTAAGSTGTLRFAPPRQVGDDL